MATDPERKPRGTPCVLTPEATSYLEHLWTQTTLSPSAVEHAIADRYGIAINPTEHAARRGFLREAVRASNQSGLSTRAAREQQMTLDALERWTQRKGPPPDNDTRITPLRFRVPAGGYRTAATR